MLRHVVGLTAILSLLVAAAIWLRATDPFYRTVEAGCWRLGALLAMVWLAYEDLVRLPMWLSSTLLVAVVIVARWPKAIVLLVPLLVLGAILRPRIGRRR